MSLPSYPTPTIFHIVSDTFLEVMYREKAWAWFQVSVSLIFTTHRFLSDNSSLSTWPSEQSTNISMRAPSTLVFVRLLMNFQPSEMFITISFIEFCLLLFTTKSIFVVNECCGSRNLKTCPQGSFCDCFWTFSCNMFSKITTLNE